MIAAVAMMSPTVPPITTPPAILPAFERRTSEEYVLEEDVGVAAGSSLEKTLEWVFEGTLEGPMSEPGPNSGESTKQVE